MRKTDRAFGR